MRGKCAYCDLDGDLCRSHAIPDAVFRPILTASNGSMISLTRDQGKVAGTNDTGKAWLLCRACETLFNRKWDGPLVNAIRKLDHAIKKDGYGCTIEYDHDALAQSLVSILWRSCVSDAHLYEGTPKGDPYTQIFKGLVTEPPAKTLKICSISIFRLRDSTTASSGGFDQNSIWQIVMPPTPHPVRLGNTHRFLRFDFVFQGFLFQVALAIIYMTYWNCCDRGFADRPAHRN